MKKRDNITRKLERIQNWDPPKDWSRIVTIDMHTAGEPLRVFLTGYPDLEGDTILEKRRFAKQNYDDLRKALMWEPRGHADMYGCVLVPSTNNDVDFGVLFLHNEGYSTMCGHAIIALTKLAAELNLVEVSKPTTQIKIDTPAGVINSFADIDVNNSVTNVYFQNVPSFVVDLGAELQVPELGRIKYDLAFGGAFYAYVRAEDFGLKCTPAYFNQLVKKGMQIKNAVEATGTVKHPFEEDLSFLYGTIFIGDPEDGGDTRNVCVFAEGEVDRSPTGTGVSGLVAIHHARKELELNEPLVIESILGTTFTASVIEETMFGGKKAIIPKIEGNAYITGRSEFLLDPTDPLKYGFILG